MTQLAKCVIETVNSSGTITQTRDERVVRAVVTRHGSRTVDTGDFTFNGRTKIDQNYNVKYIQDIVDTTRLAAIWNFQLNTRDEGGYDHDGTDLPLTRYIDPHTGVNTRKFQSQYMLDFDKTSSTDFFEVANHARLDMTKQFDLYIYCQNGGSFSTGDKAIIFSKYGSNGGIEVGFVQGQFDKHLFVRTLDSVGSPVMREGTQSTFITARPRLIRIKRDENNLVSCYLDGILEISFTEDFDYGITYNIRFGAHQHPSAPSEFWGGQLMQVRLYTGGYLSDSDAEKIQICSPQPLTMKLAGKVWKVNDNTNPITVQVKGYGKTLIEANMTSDILTGTHTSPDRTTNVYDAEESHKAIIGDMIHNVDPTFALRTPRSSDAKFIGKFVATGGLIQCIELMLLRLNNILYTTPRKMVVLEDRDGINTPFIFKQNDAAHSTGYILTSGGKDDSLLINEIEIIGRVKIKHDERGLGSISTSSADVIKTIPNRPLNIRITDSLGQVGTPDVDYKIDYESKQITFLEDGEFPDNSQITVSYDYEDIDSNEDDQLYYLNSTNGSSSVAEHGRYNRRIFVPQFTNRKDFRTLSQDILRDSADVLTRYEVVAAGHVNHMRENMIGKLINSKKDIDTSEILKSIRWEYPNMRTIMEFGEHRFDVFDLDKIASKDLQSLNASTTKTQNA